MPDRPYYTCPKCGGLLVVERDLDFLKKQFQAAGLHAKDIAHKTSLKRTYTDHSENLEVYACELTSETSATPSSADSPFSGQWVKPHELKRFAFSSAHAKIIREYL